MRRFPFLIPPRAQPKLSRFNSAKPYYSYKMPDIAQIIRDTVSKGSNSDNKPVKPVISSAAAVPATPAAVPQEIPATKPSGLERLFNSIPLPKINEPVEKCSGFADLPAEDYHLSLNSVAFIFAKNALERFEFAQDQAYQAYLSRCEAAMKEMYPLLLPVIEPLLGAASCARDHVLEEASDRTEDGKLVAYEDNLIRHIEGVGERKWEEKDFIDGEDLNTRFVQRTVRSLRKLEEQRKRQQAAQLDTLPEDVNMMNASA